MMETEDVHVLCELTVRVNIIVALVIETQAYGFYFYGYTPVPDAMECAAGCTEA